jgi:hypothetical protein
MGRIRTKKTGPRAVQPEPVTFMGRIVYQVGIYRIEKQSQDDNGGNPDFK